MAYVEWEVSAREKPPTPNCGVMRFSLLLLLSVTTAVCILLAMWDWYWWKGLWLALPHLGLLGAVFSLIKSRKLSLAVAGTAAYFALWALTAVFGVTKLHIEFVQIQDRWLRDCRRIESDPDFQIRQLPSFEAQESPGLQPPWKFVGHATVPCPFVIAIDHGYHAGNTNAAVYRAYYFVVPGYRRYLGADMYWLS